MCGAGGHRAQYEGHSTQFPGFTVWSEVGKQRKNITLSKFCESISGQGRSAPSHRGVCVVSLFHRHETCLIPLKKRLKKTLEIIDPKHESLAHIASAVQQTLTQNHRSLILWPKECKCLGFVVFYKLSYLLLEKNL